MLSLTENVSTSIFGKNWSFVAFHWKYATIIDPGIKTDEKNLSYILALDDILYNSIRTYCRSIGKQSKRKSFETQESLQVHM